MSAALMDDPSKWRSEHIWRMPDAVEPTLIISILLIAMFMTRRKNYSISTGFQTKPRRFEYSRVESAPRHTLLESSSSPPEELTDAYVTPPTSRPPSPDTTHCIHSNDVPLDFEPSTKHRRILGIWTVSTPDSSSFAKNIHSRVLVKFPFLVEMLYWAISFYLYRLTGIMAQKKYGGTSGLWDIAQGHGIGILEFESRLFGLSNKTGNARWAEYNIQQWYLTGADGGDFRGLWLTILDRGYSLIHIPGTVGYD